MAPTAKEAAKTFLSTLSLRRATAIRPGVILPLQDFYPRSPCGERLLPYLAQNIRIRFLSTLSLRRATSWASHGPLVGESSIHALLAESDIASARSGPALVPFLSTLSLRRATGLAQQKPRQPKFLSTLSLRRATVQLHAVGAVMPISIHALLAESDMRATQRKLLELHFYPRSPCGERRNHAVHDQAVRDFYPRSPCGERLGQFQRVLLVGISIHALLAESDVSY